MSFLRNAAVLVLAVFTRITVANEHLITDLPNINDEKDINFKQYAGHLPLKTEEK
jgi:hypothetical protein